MTLDIHVAQVVRVVRLLRPGERVYGPAGGWDGTPAGLHWWPPELAETAPTEAEIEAKYAEVKAADAEQDTERRQLRTEFQAVKVRLDDIVQNGSTYTAAQTRDAVIDLARAQRRMMRVLHDYVEFVDQHKAQASAI